MPCTALPHMEEEEEEESPEDGVDNCRTPDRLDSTDGALMVLFSGVIGPLDHVKLGPNEIPFIFSQILFILIIEFKF